MHATQPDPDRTLPEYSEVEPSTDTEEAQYHTTSGVTVELSDIEVDVVQDGAEEVVSSQADPEAYGIVPDETGTHVPPSEPAGS
ncbi:MAG: hypothetical protein M3R24_13740 [Chloroflexota bacterium]|nr:hypothetical protein [Chloroflexota bacterium]PLS80760.1 MAG: hypothetical protein CYG59_07125 [Chloroflexota bacterium]